MNVRILASLLVLIPGVAVAAQRDNNARVGVQRISMTGVRGPNMAQNIPSTVTTNDGGQIENNGGTTVPDSSVDEPDVPQENDKKPNSKD